MNQVLMRNAMRGQGQAWVAQGPVSSVQLPDGSGGWGHGPSAGLQVRYCADGWIENACASAGPFLVRPVGAPADGAADRAAELEVSLNGMGCPLRPEVGRALPHLTAGLLRAILRGA
jgi:hypothetical protein